MARSLRKSQTQIHGHRKKTLMSTSISLIENWKKIF